MIYVEQPQTPQRIDVVRWDGNKVSEVTPWISDALGSKRIFRTGNRVAVQSQAIGNPHAIRWVNPGDYILCYPDGRLGVKTEAKLNAQYEPEEVYIETRLRTKADQASNKMLVALRLTDRYFKKSDTSKSHHVARLVEEAITAAER